MGFLESKDNREGFEKLAEKEWVRLRMGGEKPYAQILHIGKTGLEVAMCEAKHGRYELNHQFLDYGLLQGYATASESEVQKFMEAEPVTKRYLDEYVKIKTSQQRPYMGKLSEVGSTGIYLQPFIDMNLATERLALIERPLFISGGQIQAITPTTKSQLITHINDYNNKADEQEGKKQTPFKRTSGKGF